MSRINRGIKFQRQREMKIIDYENNDMHGMTRANNRKSYRNVVASL